MSLQRVRTLVLGFALLAPLGCQPAPVVVNPDQDGDPTIIDRDLDVDVKDDTPAASGADVNVDIGRGNGVDVKVDRTRPGDNEP